MKIYVGVTNADWFRFIKARDLKSVNFWRPGKKEFRALPERGLFLFKVKKPYNCIAGGGYFADYKRMTITQAWESFAEGNGAASVQSFYAAINDNQSKEHIDLSGTQIGCILLEDVFFFDEEEWIPLPDSFSKYTVSGKEYDTEDEEGAKLYREVQKRLRKK